MSIFTRAILEINLKHLANNYRALQKVAPKSIAAAVVKNNAYGLGAVEVAAYLSKTAGCKDFFVAHAIEGEAVAKKVKKAAVYVLQGITEDTVKLFKKYKLIPVINTPNQLEIWNKSKIKKIKPVINIETGLNRLGFREYDLKKLNINENDFSFVMSHLACADELENPVNKKQYEEFIRLRNKYFPNLKMSLSASDGVFLGRDFQMDMVRLGAAVYGLNTTPYRENRMEPVLYVKAPVLQTAEIKKGETVGYSATFKAPRDMKIAIISIGYGDGFFRSLSNVGKVFFKDKEAKLLGRVSMENIVCDITGTNVAEGDFADIINDKYTADDMAAAAGTIGYEILDHFGKSQRTIRKYIK